MLPREKYLEKGIDNLSDMDLLAILVGSGTKQHNFMAVSKALVNRLKKVISKKKQIELNDITDIDGVGIVTGMKILCGVELGRRLYNLGNTPKIRIHNAQEAYYLLKDLQNKKQEYIVGLFLNSRFELLEQRTLAIGTVDSAGILPRDIIIPALELNASAVIIAHNHPSGDALPSQEDIDLTNRIKEALDLVGINLLDHLVIGNEDWKSIA